MFYQTQIIWILNFYLHCSEKFWIVFPAFQSCSVCVPLVLGKAQLSHLSLVIDFHLKIAYLHLSSKNIALETKASRYQNKFACYLLGGKNAAFVLRLCLQLLTDSLANNECFLSTYPDSHEFSIHLVVVVTGTANPHPQEPAVGNKGPDSHAIART